MEVTPGSSELMGARFTPADPHGFAQITDTAYVDGKFHCTRWFGFENYFGGKAECQVVSISFDSRFRGKLLQHRFLSQATDASLSGS